MRGICVVVFLLARGDDGMGACFGVLEGGGGEVFGLALDLLGLSLKLRGRHDAFHCHLFERLLKQRVQLGNLSVFVLNFRQKDVLLVLVVHQ